MDKRAFFPEKETLGLINYHERYRKAMTNEEDVFLRSLVACWSVVDHPCLHTCYTTCYVQENIKLPHIMLLI
jgi:hypothetical protein